THLPNEGKAMGACGLRFGTPSGDVIVDDCWRDEGIIFAKARDQKTVQFAQGASFISITVSHRMLLCQQPGELCRQGRNKSRVWRAHLLTSSSEIATARRATRLTRV